ncbi:MAG: fibrinogen-like YCDxxxxGGGW domain-containing protein [Patescibacteria group bacterium]
MPGSCKAIKGAYPASADGTYSIDYDGAGPAAPFQVLCDMTTDGGGWTNVNYNF